MELPSQESPRKAVDGDMGGTFDQKPLANDLLKTLFGKVVSLSPDTGFIIVKKLVQKLRMNVKRITFHRAAIIKVELKVTCCRGLIPRMPIAKAANVIH